MPISELPEIARNPVLQTAKVRKACKLSRSLAYPGPAGAT